MYNLQIVEDKYIITIKHIKYLYKAKFINRIKISINKKLHTLIIKKGFYKKL